VAYPLFDLHPDRLDVRRYARDLARVMIGVASDHGVDARFLEGDAKLVGVWVDAASPARWPGDPREAGGAARAEKLGAIGVRISRWVTMHGFALNVSTSLDAYQVIIPCGISRYGVTSLEALRAGGPVPTVEAVARASVAHFERVFEASGRVASAAETGAMRLRARGPA
jgi:lipoyl(octanoyl) transferase